jgi:hypothetical protein
MLFLTLSTFSFISVAMLIYTRSIYPKDIEVSPKRISLGILRGPLTRYVISVSTPALGLVSLFIAIYWVGSEDLVLGAIYIYYPLVPMIALGFAVNQLFSLLVGVVLAIEDSIQRAVVGNLARGREAIAYGYYHLVYGLASAVGGYMVGYLAEHEMIPYLLTISIALSAFGALILTTITFNSIFQFYRRSSYL